MKIPMQRMAGLLAVLMILAAAAPAQTPAKARRQSSEARTRGLFVSKKADAMRVVILKAEGNAMAPVAPNHEFAEGDQIRVAFESNFDGYIYLINVSPGGKKLVLFPQADTVNNAVRSNQRYEFPAGSEVIEFDNEKGTEVLQVVMSRERVPYLEDAIKNSRGELGESASAAAAELQGGLTGEKVEPVIPKQGPSGVRTRDLKFAAGRNKDPEGSVVAIEGSGAKGKLDKGEVAVFEIRLKHN